MLTHPMPVDNVTLFDYPINLISEGRFPTIPVLMGFTTDEGAMISTSQQVELYHKWYIKSYIALYT